MTSFDMELAKNAPLMSSPHLGVDINLIPPEHRRPYSDEEMWANFEYFLKAVIPAAEQAGVKMALHPDDPPVPSLGGVARVFRSVEAFKRVIELVPSDYNGLRFCQGCFAEMGANVVEAIRYFGSRKRIFYVHFRDVRGTATRFEETFIDGGKTDMLAAMRAYKEVGYDGPIMDDHVPHVVDDTAWGHRGRAYATGYIKALIRAVSSSP